MRLTLTVPPSVLETAKRASQALDEDIGGYNAFESQDEAGNYFYPVELSQAFVEQITAMMDDANLLHGFISQQFAARFPDDTVPTLQDCELLTSVITVS